MLSINSLTTDKFLQYNIQIIYLNMLARPPKLSTQENQSQVYTESHQSKRSVSKNKIKKKETSIGGNARNRTISNASDYSQTSKSPYKETDNNYTNFIKENDTVSVGSHVSGKSKKQKKKQTSLKTDRSNKALNYKRQMQDSIKGLDENHDEFRNRQQYREPQQRSEVKHIPLCQSPAESPYKFITEQGKKVSNHISRQNIKKPFSQIQLNDDDDDLPVIKIQEKPEQLTIHTPKIAERAETKKFGEMFDENKKNATNVLYQQNKSIVNNNSSISDSFWQTSNVEVSQTGSRQSRSKLGALFKQKSREKKTIEDSGNLNNSRERSRSRGIFDHKNKKINKSNESQVTTNRNFPQHSEKPAQKQPQPSHLSQESRVGSKYVNGSKLGVSAVQKHYIQPKNLESSQDLFDGGDLTHSQLDLSQSHNNGHGYTYDQKKSQNNAGSSFNQKDSLCFQLEPEKSRRKGLGIVSKSRKQQKNMIQIKGELDSVGMGEAKPIQKQMIAVSGILESKAIDVNSARNKVLINLKQNQKYLNESGYGNSEEKKLKKEKEQELKRIERQEEAKKRERQKEQIKEYRRKQEEETERKLKQKEEFLRMREEQLEREERERQLRQIQFREQKQMRQRQIQMKRKQMEEQKQKEIRAKEEEASIQRQKQKQRQAKLERQRQIELEMERQKQRRVYEQRQKELRERELRLQQKQNQIKRNKQLQLKRQQEEKERQVLLHKVPELQNLPSTYSRENSEAGSSKSVKKNQKKKESSINLKPKRKYIGDISPRGEESFYEESVGSQEEIPEPQKKQNHQTKLISFSEEQDETPKQGASREFKTDMNFYENSIKVPSSKPPLSRKSSSKSKNKPKESSISKKKDLSKVSKIGNNNTKQNNQKKLTLVELALQKDYEPRSDSEYSCDNSQNSFRSRDQSYDGVESRGKSYDSRNSKNSRGSRKSMKKQSVISRKQSGLPKPPISRRKYSHEEELSEVEKQRQKMQLQLQNSQPIVSKDCCYIDERGRLVQKDIVIKGNKVYSGTDKYQFNPDQVYNRLKRSREKRRSRSKSRERSSERSRIGDHSRTMNQFNNLNSKNQTRPIFIESEAYTDSGVESSSAENFYNYHSQQNYCNSKVEQKSRKTEHRNQISSYGSSYSQFPQSYQKSNNSNLTEFLKPIQPQYRGYNEETEKQQAPIMRKRGIKRTQRSGSKPVRR